MYIRQRVLHSCTMQSHVQSKRCHLENNIKHEEAKYISLGDPFDEVRPVTSMWSKLYSLWGRQSNALDRSIKIAAIFNNTCVGPVPFSNPQQAAGDSFSIRNPFGMPKGKMLSKKVVS